MRHAGKLLNASTMPVRTGPGHWATESSLGQYGWGCTTGYRWCSQMTRGGGGFKGLFNKGWGTVSGAGFISPFTDAPTLPEAMSDFRGQKGG
eukprot:767241-Hanusia_phi.AAC.2